MAIGARPLRYEVVMSVNVPVITGLGVFFARDGHGFFGWSRFRALSSRQPHVWQFFAQLFPAFSYLPYNVYLPLASHKTPHHTLTTLPKSRHHVCLHALGSIWH